MNGIIYCRVSSEEQVKGTSLESQELSCKEYARTNGINVVKIFTEEGESAKFVDRTKLLELLDYCKKNKGLVQILIVWKLDRFSRIRDDYFGLKATLLKSGVKLVSATEHIDETAEGRLMETMLAGIAQFDNDIRADRTREGMRARIRGGIYPWRAPIGYKSSITKGEKKTKADTPDQPLFGLLQKAWKEFATGAYTKAEILRRMNTWGVLTGKGRRFSPQSLDYFFRNKYYAGILVDHSSGKEYKGQHIPMIGKEVFATVQNVINKRNRTVPHQKERPEFPLRGFVRCCNCIHYMTGSFSRGRSSRYPYYHCYHKMCPMNGRTKPAHSIHDEFEGFLDKVALRSDSFSELQATVLSIAEDRFSLSKSKKARREVQSKQLGKEIHELITMRAKKLINDDQFLAEKSLLSERQLLLENNNENDNLDTKFLSRNLGEIMQPLGELRQTWKSLPQPYQFGFQQLILPAGFVNGKIGTADLGLLFSLSNTLTERKTSLVPQTYEIWNQIVKEIDAFSEILKHLPHSKAA
jgi:site-specific DNA recombinase